MIQSPYTTDDKAIVRLFKSVTADIVGGSALLVVV
jgi:hypothetical protein